LAGERVMTKGFGISSFFNPSVTLRVPPPFTQGRLRNKPSLLNKGSPFGRAPALAGERDLFKSFVAISLLDLPSPSASPPPLPKGEACYGLKLTNQRLSLRESSRVAGERVMTKGFGISSFYNPSVTLRVPPPFTQGRLIAESCLRVESNSCIRAMPGN